MPQRLIRLGTRRSLLARAQSSAVARSLERAHPGLRVELLGIDTRGDRILDVPLSKVDGKEFFTAEIDAALREGAVDITVHSFKDLSLERPAELCLGAVPARANPRDIALFAPDVVARLAAGEPLRVGSSSPRRQAFVPAFLESVLPRFPGVPPPRVQLCELRGNVDTRLRRLREPRGSERQLDAVVLAFAGLSRLCQDEAVGAADVLRELLAGLPRMLLPLTDCPAAPAQGALAIECRSDDAATRALLAAIDDAPTRAAIATERALLAERGGGCHQRFGATRVHAGVLGDLLYVREANASGACEPQLRWQSPASLPRVANKEVWDGSRHPTAGCEALPQAQATLGQALGGCDALFVSHRRALPAELPESLRHCAHVWVPGTGTWSALAARGLWVEGCAESLGFDALRPLLAEPLLGLPAASRWLALTNEEALAGWSGISALATYRHADTVPAAPGTGAAGAAGPTAALRIWWHSGVQFDRWRAQLRPGAVHACGPGKTADRLRQAGLDPLVFPGVRQWREWLQA
jgi:hydroxymethylbilane synthase